MCGHAIQSRAQLQKKVLPFAEIASPRNCHFLSSILKHAASYNKKQYIKKPHLLKGLFWKSLFTLQQTDETHFHAWFDHPS